jgi:transcription elongation factor Elf1
MLTEKQKVRYLLSSLLSSGQRVRCPYCKNHDCREIDRKYFVTKLLECQVCHLYFRFPVDRVNENANFYQTDYQESDKITTGLPDKDSLEKMKRERFTAEDKNADRYLQIFAKLFPGEDNLRIIDYGSSWGYTSYQFKLAGHQVQGFEISLPRASYGVKNLEVDICSDEKLLRKENHIFFSSHVIEHHPDIAAMIELGKSLLMNGGYFIAFCPNGSQAFRQKYPEVFHRFWGKVHPNFLNAEFYKHIFEDQPYYIASSPIVPGKLRPLQEPDKVVDDLSGEELMVVVKYEKS